jgi:SAM-dependent methyltransferase
MDWDNDPDLEGRSFTTRVGSHGPVLNFALASYASETAIRILDIGCGDGDMLFQLAAHYPNAQLVGADLSPANIQIAKERSQALGLSERCEFLCGDYLGMPIAPANLIVSNSTLHLIEAPPLDLHRKIARDLVPNGILIASVPYECAYNSLLIFVRRIFRRLRGPLTDRLLEAIGNSLEGGKLSPEMMRERIVYMYIIPSFLAGPTFDRRLAQIGLRRERILPYPHASIAQPKHRVGVYRRV